MKTIVIQIGNTDDKLKQSSWAAFVERMRAAIAKDAHAVHFFGASAGWERWQNAAWVIAVKEDRAELLKKAVTEIRGDYFQDSAAWTEGETQFI